MKKKPDKRPGERKREKKEIRGKRGFDFTEMGGCEGSGKGGKVRKETKVK